MIVKDSRPTHIARKKLSPGLSIRTALQAGRHSDNPKFGIYQNQMDDVKPTQRYGGR